MVNVPLNSRNNLLNLQPQVTIHIHCIDIGITIAVFRLMVSDWVVLYNPYLQLKYNAHINVENCSTVRAVNTFIIRIQGIW